MIAALPNLTKGTAVPGLYSHIAHSNDKEKLDIPQLLKGPDQSNLKRFRGRSQGHGRANYHGRSHGRSNYQGNNNYQYHQYYGHDDEYQTDQYGPPCALCGGYDHSPKHCFKGEHDINNIMEKMNISGHQSQSSGLYSKRGAFKSLNIFISIFKTMKRYMNQILMQLGMKLITPYTHILIMILNMVYLKMLLIAII